jgi:hydrogenase expression/formation protein HypC
MCIGIPMRVVATEGPEGCVALCEGRGGRRCVNMMLVGEQPVGAWVLVHLDSAREVLDEARAAQLDEALDALAAALRGESIEGRFDDLPDRATQGAL